MRAAPNQIAPRSSAQKPAIMRSKVVLPQPEGPSKVKNSPSAMSSETSRTEGTAPKLRPTPSIRIEVKGDRMPHASAGLLDQVLDLRHGRGALRGPGRLVVGHQLDRRQRRHAARQLREVEILAGRPAERLGEDQLAHVLAVDEVDESLGRVGVGSALEDGAALHR